MSDKEKQSYEKSDVATKKLFIAAGSLVIFIVVIIVALNSFFLASKEQQIYDAVLKPTSTELRELRVRENEALTTYKMLDKQNGVVQIPIERAMKLMADEAFERSTK